MTQKERIRQLEAKVVELEAEILRLKNTPSAIPFQNLSYYLPPPVTFKVPKGYEITLYEWIDEEGTCDTITS